MDLFIGKGQILLCGVKQATDSLELGTGPGEFAQHFLVFTKENESQRQRPITLYVGDDYLYFSRISLPKQTPDVEKAISLQLDMLSPFGEDCLYAHEIQHEKETIDVSLYFADHRIILPLIETISGLGWHITGMYPESQRGLTKDNLKKTWGLLSGGLFTKLTIFNTGHVRERIQISGEIDSNGLKKIYKLEFIQNLADIPPIPSPPVFPLNFDLLPPSFRRINYFKWALVGLVGLNLVLGMVWLSTNFVQIHNKINRIETLQAELAPELQEVKKLKKQHTAQANKLKSYESIVKNKDLINLFATLTQELPKSSYLEQLRLDKKTGAIHIQGYTTSLTELTASLQMIGDATLESTRKRKGQTYFQIEVVPK